MSFAIAHSRRGIALSLAIIFVGLAGRAAVDKLLALRGGPELVGLWAQLQSVADLVSGIVLAGLGYGLTALVAQVEDPARQRTMLKSALGFAMPIPLVAMISISFLPDAAKSWIVGGRLSGELIALGAFAGWLGTLSGLASAYSLGKQRRGLVLLVALTMVLPVTAWTLLGDGAVSPGTMLVAQCVSSAIVVAGFAATFAGLATASGESSRSAIQDRRDLARFIPAGIAIGILSPTSLLLSRGIVADHLSWHDAGLVQALWRSSECITAFAAGILSLYFFPRMSACADSPQFGRELRHAFMLTLLPAALLLYLLYSNQKPALALLYDEQFALSDRAAGFFFLGDWVRIGSWVFLYAMFAMRRTWLIVLGELFSLPLFTALLQLAGYKLDLERVGLAYLTTYICYFVFNWLATMGGYQSRQTRTSTPAPDSAQVN